MTNETDLTGLTAKRDELLAENKKLKARLAEVEKERDVQIERADTAEGQYRQKVIDGPIDDLLADLFVVPLKYVRDEVMANLTFEPDEEVGFRVLDKEGNVFEMDGQPVKFERESVRQAIDRIGTLSEVLRGGLATGGGALGSRGRSGVISTPAPKPKVASKFGLR